MDNREVGDSESQDRDADRQAPFDRFQALTKRLLHVSKDDVREAESREQEKRRTA